jgi:hypothetical protein
LRSGLGVAGVAGVPPPQLITFCAELPADVKVGVPVAAFTSHALPVTGSRTLRWHPGAAVRHHVTRVSVPLEFSGGVAGKTAHRGLSESKSTRSSRSRTLPSRAST